MLTSAVATKAKRFAETGHYAKVVDLLSAGDPSELEASPGLALLFGTAHARLGHRDEGLRWLNQAELGARTSGETLLERHAMTARGALALVSGKLNEAADLFTQAMVAAGKDGDFAATGRCANNLGIISNLRGRHAEAIASWEIALAAFHRAGMRQGMAECYHNLAISYREQGALDRAVVEADRAVAEAQLSGDRTLGAVALRGRAELWVVRGDLETARGELDRVAEIRSQFPDPVSEAEDLRVVALVQAASGQTATAERHLREAAERGETFGRPHLVAEAMRDLAVLLVRSGRNGEAKAAARAARAIFVALGAEGEIRQLAARDWDTDFATELRRSLEPLHQAQALADAGRYAELVAHLDGVAREELEHSPMLAVLMGIGHTRLGRLDVGRQWVMVGLTRARELGDRAVEVRALNVCGAIALERGGMAEATHFFASAQEEAAETNDMITVGRAANNLGIIANLQGDYSRAVGAYTRAIAAYQQAHHELGIAESQHNLAISYREQGQLDHAMQAADAAVRDAQRVHNPRFKAQALAGQAEVWLARGEPQVAAREIERALEIHEEMKDEVLVTEDQRILGVALGRIGQREAADMILQTVIERATAHRRPLLVAMAQRDLAQLRADNGDAAAARDLAQVARAAFDELGAKGEVAKLDAGLLKAEAVPTA
jgi:tetratricopeptide (TPR) repeat protein